MSMSSRTSRDSTSLPNFPPDDVELTGHTIQDLVSSLAVRRLEWQSIMQITARINAGLFLDDVLEAVYRDFKTFIPYDRIGVSLINERSTHLRSIWAKAEYPNLKLKNGYAARIEGSSLAQIIQSGEPRILNNLETYLATHTHSASTKLMLEEGIHSSLTCPLIANGVPIGVIFFSSLQPNTYNVMHSDLFLQIASQLSVMVEKGRLTAQLARQKHAAEEQSQTLTRLNELKNLFLGVAAHDLRNPLSVVLSTAELMIDPEAGLTPEEQIQLAGNILNQAVYMNQLLNDLLDVAHTDSGKLTLNKTPIAVRPCLAECVQRHNALSMPKGTSIVIGDVHDGYIFADQVRVRQIMDNLLSNAVKYSPAHSVIQIHVHYDPQAAQWRFEVQDQGPGLTANDKRKVFQDFSRLSAKPTNAESSTGLGLSIVRRLVEAHGGQVGVESKLGKGATFWFTMQAAQPDMQ